MATTILSHKQFLADLLDATPDGVLAFDRECRYTVWNAAMERISGVPRSEALGRPAFKLFPFLEEIGEDRYFREALAGRTVISENRPYSVSETGRRGFFEARYSPLYHGGEIVGGVGVIRDISQRKEIEEEKTLAQQGLTLLIENSPLAVIEWDSDFRVSRWSESAERLFGWKAEEVLGKHVSDWRFVVAEDLTAVEQVGQRQREGSERQGVLYNRNYSKAGSVLHCEWYNSVLTAESGELVSILSLVLDVTARKLAEEQLATLLSSERAARREAEEADRLKDEFLATLSHELRTPLTAVLGWASLMRSGDFPEADFHRALEIIERNARSQARLIDDLLDVSRVITGNLRLETSHVNLSGVIEAARDVVRPATDAKGIRLTLDFDPSTPPVNGDPNRLRQVVWNLLLNAIKFTPRGGSVTVKLEPVELQARLTVSDTGEGISPDFLPYVFDRFRQAEASVSRRQGGLGLGLAVVRHLVELHGGSVGVQSEGKGKGAVFTIDLPCVSEHEDLPDETPVSEPPSTSDRVKPLDGLRILVVEDDDDSRALVGTLLKNQGAIVSLAESVQEAMKVLEKIVPDVVVSDLGMPDEDGYALIAKLRRLPADKGGIAPAIALTGYATGKDREQALAAGYQMHMAKPIEPEALVAAVAKLSGAEQLSSLKPAAQEN
ncbi:MAG TPA: PAS domain S-box protein [Pyrinomonadaceae bacterium]|nr:PAS domain S-box protein [Pyrinomonadaceae bacterium]